MFLWRDFFMAHLFVAHLGSLRHYGHVFQSGPVAPTFIVEAQGP
jgi:hypothetical protein